MRHTDCIASDSSDHLLCELTKINDNILRDFITGQVEKQNKTNLVVHLTVHFRIKSSYRG